MVKQLKKDLDVRFVEVPFRCSRCGHEGKEIIVVANNVGVLDTQCEKCKKRVVEVKFVENNQ